MASSSKAAVSTAASSTSSDKIAEQLKRVSDLELQQLHVTLSDPDVADYAKQYNLVWAQVKGYPWWPAQIMTTKEAKIKFKDTPQEWSEKRMQNSFPVTFFETTEIAWLPTKQVKQWADGIKDGCHTKLRTQKTFRTALQKVTDLLKLRRDSANWLHRVPENARGARRSASGATSAEGTPLSRNHHSRSESDARAKQRAHEVEGRFMDKIAREASREREAILGGVTRDERHRRRSESLQRAAAAGKGPDEGDDGEEEDEGLEAVKNEGGAGKRPHSSEGGTPRRRSAPTPGPRAPPAAPDLQQRSDPNPAPSDVLMAAPKRHTRSQGTAELGASDLENLEPRKTCKRGSVASGGDGADGNTTSAQETELAVVTDAVSARDVRTAAEKAVAEAANGPRAGPVDAETEGLRMDVDQPAPQPVPSALGSKRPLREEDVVKRAAGKAEERVSEVVKRPRLDALDADGADAAAPDARQVAAPAMLQQAPAAVTVPELGVVPIMPDVPAAAAAAAAPVPVAATSTTPAGGAAPAPNACTDSMEAAAAAALAALAAAASAVEHKTTADVGAGAHNSEAAVSQIPIRPNGMEHVPAVVDIAAQDPKPAVAAAVEAAQQPASSTADALAPPAALASAVEAAEAARGAGLAAEGARDGAADQGGAAEQVEAPLEEDNTHNDGDLAGDDDEEDDEDDNHDEDMDEGDNDDGNGSDMSGNGGKDTVAGGSEDGDGDDDEGTECGDDDTDGTPGPGMRRSKRAAPKRRSALEMVRGADARRGRGRGTRRSGSSGSKGRGGTRAAAAAAAAVAADDFVSTGAEPSQPARPVRRGRGQNSARNAEVNGSARLAAAQQRFTANAAAAAVHAGDSRMSSMLAAQGERPLLNPTNSAAVEANSNLVIEEVMRLKEQAQHRNLTNGELMLMQQLLQRLEASPADLQRLQEMLLNCQDPYRGPGGGAPVPPLPELHHTVGAPKQSLHAATNERLHLGAGPVSLRACFELPHVPTTMTEFELPREMALMRTVDYQHVDVNKYKPEMRPKKLKAAQIQICNCRRDKEHETEDTYCCGPGCLNKKSRFVCDVRSCPCRGDCQNKPFNLRKAPKTEVVLTENRGNGLFAREGIPRGGFVVEYAGEVISEPQRLQRLMEARQKGIVHFYIMELSKGLYIDAERMGSKARFMNSSCEPNCEAQKWKDAATGETRIGIFAVTDIQPGEELTYDYHFQHSGLQAAAQGFRCMCGAPSCRGTMDVNPDRVRDVGRRIRIQWLDQEWFEGVIMKYHPSNGKHTIYYTQSGEHETLSLREAPHEWIDQPYEERVSGGGAVPSPRGGGSPNVGAMINPRTGKRPGALALEHALTRLTLSRVKAEPGFVPGSVPPAAPAELQQQPAAAAIAAAPADRVPLPAPLPNGPARPAPVRPRTPEAAAEMSGLEFLSAICEELHDRPHTPILAAQQQQQQPCDGGQNAAANSLASDMRFSCLARLAPNVLPGTTYREALPFADPSVPGHVHTFSSAVPSTDVFALRHVPAGQMARLDLGRTEAGPLTAQHLRLHHQSADGGAGAASSRATIDAELLQRLSAAGHPRAQQDAHTHVLQAMLQAQAQQQQHGGGGGPNSHQVAIQRQLQRLLDHTRNCASDGGGLPAAKHTEDFNGIITDEQLRSVMDQIAARRDGGAAVPLGAPGAGQKQQQQQHLPQYHAGGGGPLGALQQHFVNRRSSEPVLAGGGGAPYASAPVSSAAFASAAQKRRSSNTPLPPLHPGGGGGGGGGGHSGPGANRRLSGPGAAAAAMLEGLTSDAQQLPVYGGSLGGSTNNYGGSTTNYGGTYKPSWLMDLPDEIVSAWVTHATSLGVKDPLSPSHKSTFEQFAHQLRAQLEGQQRAARVAASVAAVPAGTR